MSCIVYQTDRKGNKYAYESTSYWDKSKGQPRSKRKYIGKVDPETGEIIPSKRSRKTTDTAEESRQSSADENRMLQKLYDEIKSRDNRIAELRNEKKQLEGRCRKMSEIIRTISVIAGEAADV